MIDRDDGEDYQTVRDLACISLYPMDDRRNRSLPAWWFSLPDHEHHPVRAAFSGTAATLHVGPRGSKAPGSRLHRGSAMERVDQIQEDRYRLDAFTGLLLKAKRKIPIRLIGRSLIAEPYSY